MYIYLILIMYVLLYYYTTIKTRQKVVCSGVLTFARNKQIKKHHAAIFLFAFNKIDVRYYLEYFPRDQVIITNTAFYT